ncbi:sugar phosphate nucleotidyltransferase, partial [Echinicola sediminis]
MVDFSDLLVHKRISIRESLELMDSLRKKLLIVIDNEDKFVSLLSIGDCQRAILKGVDLERCIEEILISENIVASPWESEKEIKSKMLKIRAEFMPIVDELGQISDVIFWEDVFGNETERPLNKFDLPVVIMAGGFGTRLKPITNVLPKPLIPIGDKSMLEEIFLKFYRHDSKRFFISVNYKADLIEYYLKSLN